MGIGFCLSQAGMLSGLKLAVFSMSRLELEVEAAGSNLDTAKVPLLRGDANAILTTIPPWSGSPCQPCERACSRYQDTDTRRRRALATCANAVRNSARQHQLCAIKTIT